VAVLAVVCLGTGIAVCFTLRAQSKAPTSEAVTIRVHTDQPYGKLPPIWNFWGYDEPNYTYAANGKKLLRELAALTPEPVYIRTHNLLTTGDGTAALKWGSTNVYTEDSSGNPVYSWEILDRIFDAYRDAGGSAPCVLIRRGPRSKCCVRPGSGSRN